MTILVCPAGAVRAGGGSGGRALVGRSMLTPGSYPGGLRRGRCRGVGEGGGSLEAGGGPEPGGARADNRARSGLRAAEDEKRERARDEKVPCTAPRGPGSLRFPTEVAALCLSPLPLSRAGRVLGAQSSPSPALPPTLRPALRAPRSGPRRRRPQPFISAAASAGAAHWLQPPSPTSSRRPTARQVEASARWPGLAFWGLVLPDSGSFDSANPNSCPSTPFRKSFLTGRQGRLSSVQHLGLEERRGRGGICGPLYDLPEVLSTRRQGSKTSIGKGLGPQIWRDQVWSPNAKGGR